MKKSTKVKALVTSLALSAALATTAGISYAAENAAGENPMSNLVSAIATKFNLDETAVQAVFDEQREVMKTEHEAMFADRIAQAVTDGDLTQDQANLIQDKRTALESQHESLADATVEERRATMKTTMEELRQWAIDNNIPKEYVPFGGQHRGPGGEKGFRMHGEKDRAAEIDSAN